MRQTFKNGATRDRARAWGLWLLFVTAWSGMAVVCGETSPWGWLGLLLALGLGSQLILLRCHPRKIPVLNYHSVSADPEWLQIADQVSLTPAAFERQLQYLNRHGYRTLFISELSDVLAGTRRLAPKVKYVALTFDDGYADNWMAAFPLLQAYGFKATLFVSTGFIEDAATCRPFGWPMSGNARDWSGYLTWPELRTMRASGLIEIQSHGQAHTRVLAGTTPKGFVGPGKPNLWLLWNTRPETRSSWWRELAADRSLWGHPVFPQAPALAHRAWRPDPDAVSHVMSWAQAAAGQALAMPDWERRLHAEWRRGGHAAGKTGSWESQEEYERRVEEDVRSAKQVLERELHTQVNALCWPENAFSEAGERIARGAGYTITVSNRHNTRNLIGESPDRIVRTFIGSHAAGFRNPFLDFVGFILELKVFEGWYVAYPLLFCFHRAKRSVRAVRQLLLPHRHPVAVRSGREECGATRETERRA